MWDKIKGLLKKDFPDDTNGEVLKGMKKSGMDLSKSYDIDFEHLFPTEDGARAMVEAVKKTGYKTEISYGKEVKGWDCRVVVHMKPTHEEITATEESLGKIAEEHGGHSDGWGVMQE